MDDNIDNIEISRTDLIRLVKFIEEANHLFHQPMYYEDIEMVKNFADRQYPEIHHLLYKVMTEIIPTDLKKELWDI